SSICSIVFRESQITVLLIIARCFGITVLPAAVHYIPNHAHCFQHSHLTLAQPTASVTGPGVVEPVAQGNTRVILVLAWYLQVAILLMVSFSRFQSSAPGCFGPGFPHHPDAVQLVDLLLRQHARLTFAPPQPPLGLHPVAQAQSSGGFVPQRDPQVA